MLLLSGTPEGLFVHGHGGNSGPARCNRSPDGAFVPGRLSAGVTVDDRGC